LPPVLIDSDARSVIRLEGEIDIESAEELKAMIAGAIASKKELQFDMEFTTDLDVTAVQLLCCAAREAEKTGMPFAVAHLPERIRDRIREMGLGGFPPQTASSDDR
jgi:anti-anti-sigma factor